MRRYLESLEAESVDHDESLVPLLAQSVQREAYGTSLQRPLRRKVENLLLGDARKRGQTHQWMYDRLNLQQALEAAGFERVVRHRFDTSAIPGWNEIGLDALPDGSAYKPGSLYVEAQKPLAAPRT